jgi:hypothetical protein
MDGWGQGKPCDRPVVQRAVVRMDHHPRRPDPRMVKKGFQAMPQHRYAAQRLILLGNLAAETVPAAGGDDQGHAAAHGRTPQELFKTLRIVFPRPGM